MEGFNRSVFGCLADLFKNHRETGKCPRVSHTGMEDDWSWPPDRHSFAQRTQALPLWVFAEASFAE
jgi:hypothetical protein